jgi:hypothetical protein
LRQRAHRGGVRAPEPLLLESVLERGPMCADVMTLTGCPGDLSEPDERGEHEPASATSIGEHGSDSIGAGVRINHVPHKKILFQCTLNVL